MTLQGLYAIVDASIIGARVAPSNSKAVGASPLMMPNQDLASIAEDYLKGGASIIQLRDKRRQESPERRALFEKTAERIQALKSRYSFIWIVNDDLETANRIGADGIHVGKDDPSIEECRKILGPEKMIGYSSHALEEAMEAERQGADYVAFGAIFPTPTKGPGHPVQGVERLREVVHSLKVPVVAIGGIDAHNIDSVLKTGVASIAMISSLAKDSPEERTHQAAFFQKKLFQG